jgi:hypothetical protein
MSKISFSIDSQGNFTGSTSSPVQQGTTVTFTLTMGDAMSTVYIFNGTSLDSTLFGAPSVTVPGLYVISAEAVIGRNYTLSTSPDPSLPVGVIKGNINVGSGLVRERERIPSLEGMRFPPSSRLRDDSHGHPASFVPDSSP